MNQPHDKAYKRLFSHKSAVEDLLRAYVKADWLALLDLPSLERTHSDYISEASQSRSNDIIWRVRWRHQQDEGWLYIYLFLEFQSSPAADMAVRLAEYIALFYRDLIKAKAVPVGTQLALPPVIPIVLYNGRQIWAAATDLAELIRAPEELAHLQLSLQYVLLDETRMRIDHAAEQNLVSLLFRLEQSCSPDDVQAVGAALARALDGEEQTTLRQAVGALLRESFALRLHGFQIPSTLPLDEVPLMLGDNIAEWAEGQRAEALEQGIEQGREQGLAKGKSDGMVSMLQHLVDTGSLSMAEARSQLVQLIANGELSQEAGNAALARFKD